MGDQIKAFISSFNLQSSQAQQLTSRLLGDSNLEAFLTGTDKSVSSSVLLACQTAQVLLGDGSVDTEPVNKSMNEGNWSEACLRSPSCIVLPASAEELSKTLKIVRSFQTKFSVRSGGHSPNPGWSSIEKPGILIDLRRLNQITVSDDKKTVSLGPGARWGDVYATLDPHGVSVIGGRIAPVGVAGLILGGGLFHFSGEHGLAADNVKNFEIVLADGSIENANAQENNDLFMALKGGGSNFGLVTRFDLYSIQMKDIWYQVGVYSNDLAPNILDAFAKWQESGASDVKSTVALIIGLETTTLGLIYSAPAEKPPAFSPFYDIPALTLAVPPINGTVLSLTQLLATTFSNTPMRHDYRGAASKIDAQLYKDVYAVWKEQADAVHEATGANMTFTIQPIPANLVTQGKAKGGNALGLPEIDHQWWTTLVDWENASDDAKVRSAPIATSTAWQKLGEDRDLNIPFVFMNDASRDQNPLASYGAASLEKLRAVSQKYDPTQLFQRLQNDGFLLSKV